MRHLELVDLSNPQKAYKGSFANDMAFSFSRVNSSSAFEPIKLLMA
ncbi:MAG: hypothetical protein FJZ67_02875 [Bacteroidetes bacterium]|nr:hypothetical protein [Bacteroidota bacterium]